MDITLPESMAGCGHGTMNLSDHVITCPLMSTQPKLRYWQGKCEEITYYGNRFPHPPGGKLPAWHLIFLGTILSLDFSVLIIISTQNHE
jgi:hypothetical protein